MIKKILRILLAAFSLWTAIGSLSILMYLYDTIYYDETSAMKFNIQIGVFLFFAFIGLYQVIKLIDKK